MGINISATHLKIVQQILQKYLSTQAHIWVFGSRATGASQQYSDLDLLIDDNGKALTLTTLSGLIHAFDESSLPFKVDVVDHATISQSFLKQINNKMLLLPTPHQT